MEERIIDKEDGRLVRLKKTADGETDVVEGEGEDEVVFELPEEDEYDEDLVGLTPSQLKEELARRERLAREARERSATLTEKGLSLLKEQNFEEAADTLYEASCLDPENIEAGKGLWIARTKDFTDLDPLYEEENFLALSERQSQREYVLERAGEELASARERLKEEEETLAPPVEQALRERREVFKANKKYYLVRLLAVFCALVGAGIAIAVSASYILRTTSIAPVVSTVAFGVAAFAVLVLLILYMRKTLVAHRLCRENEKLSSTADGARLQTVRDRLDALSFLFGEREDGEETEEDGRENIAEQNGESAENGEMRADRLTDGEKSDIIDENRED